MNSKGIVCLAMKDSMLTAMTLYCDVLRLLIVLQFQIAARKNHELASRTKLPIKWAYKYSKESIRSDSVSHDFIEAKARAT